MNCEFSNPVDYQNNPPALPTDFWQFKNVACTEEIFELVENENTGASFFVEKTFSYGDALILWFLTLFTLVLITKIIFNFFWHR